MDKTKVQMTILKDQMLPMKDEIKTLREVLSNVAEMVSQNGSSSKLILLFKGPQIPGNALDFVRSVLVDKLKLSELSSNVLRADYDEQEKGVVFEVSSAFNKHLILARANALLENSKYKIKEFKKTRLIDIEAIDVTEPLVDDTDEVFPEIDIRMTADERVATTIA